MMGSLLTRALVMLLGYAYPAYECYKTVELNKPEIEQLRFWCQYWILVALLTVFERVGDTFVSWVPMYSEAKLAFYVYLWYPKTRGTSYVYDTFFRPYIAKHETEIDRNLLELRTRAGDMLVLYWQRAASFGQTRFFEILQYVASQSQAPRSRPVQRQQQQQQQQQQPQQARQTPAAAPPVRQLSASRQAQEPTRAPPSPTKTQQQQGQPTHSGGHPPAASSAQPQTSSAAAPNPAPAPASSETGSRPSPSEEEPMQVETANLTPDEDSNPTPQETVMEEAIRVTRGRLRKRAMGAAAAPAGR